MPASVNKLRCAVYTRKSTDDGLVQAFNSLDAQRDACEAYVDSQRAEGWVLVRDRYDDGGVSGGPWSGRRCSGCWPTSSAA
jgi:DNA invertase Pin-like site-specific DNA recombinase